MNYLLTKENNTVSNNVGENRGQNHCVSAKSFICTTVLWINYFQQY